MIEKYEFGLMKIDGMEYRKDMLIMGDKIKNWHRIESHSVAIPDIEKLIKNKPQVIVIGTGANGLMEIPEKTVKFILNKGIELCSAITDEAVEKYNTFLKEGVKVAAGFHITC
jgi:hypothetical protein